MGKRVFRRRRRRRDSDRDIALKKWTKKEKKNEYYA